MQKEAPRKRQAASGARWPARPQTQRIGDKAAQAAQIDRAVVMRSKSQHACCIHDGRGKDDICFGHLIP